MRISINQPEIEQAIREYMSRQISLSHGKTFKIDMMATRGANGFTADIEIVDDPAGYKPITVSEETGEVKPAPQGVVEIVETSAPKKSSLFSQIHTV